MLSLPLTYSPSLLVINIIYVDLPFLYPVFYFFSLSILGLRIYIFHCHFLLDSAFTYHISPFPHPYSSLSLSTPPTSSFPLSPNTLSPHTAPSYITNLFFVRHNRFYFSLYLRPCVFSCGSTLTPRPSPRYINYPLVSIYACMYVVVGSHPCL